MVTSPSGPLPVALALRLLALPLLLAGCANDAPAPRENTKPDTGADAPADPVLENSVRELAAADSVGIWLADFDRDGVMDIALARAASQEEPTSEGAHALAVRSLALDTTGAELASAVFLLRPELDDFTLSSLRDGLQVAGATLLDRLSSADFAGLLDVIKNAGSAWRVAKCELLPELIGSLAKKVAREQLGEEKLRQLIEASLGADPSTTADASLGSRDEESFLTCVAKPQTLLGCVGIQVLSAVGRTCEQQLEVCDLPGLPVNPLCLQSAVAPIYLTCRLLDDKLERRDHCYQVPRPEPGEMCGGATAGLTLCNKGEHDNGCCNQDFIFNTVFRSDLRNQAPMALHPATGPLPDMPSTVELDGSGLYLADHLSLSLPRADVSPVAAAAVGAATCFGLGIDATQTRLTVNPVTVSVNMEQRCAYNVTQASHVLEGQVQQCVRDTVDAVTTTVLGTGTDTRFAGLNETQGAHIFVTVTSDFKQRVADALRRMQELGLSCDGDRVLGGCVAIDPDGGLVMLRGESDCNSPEARVRGAATDGDPHLRTFDGLRYDLQVAGELVLLEPTSGTAPTIQVRQQPLADALCPHVALNTAVATRVGNARLGFYAGAKLTALLDGVPVELAVGGSLALEGGRLERRELGWQLHWADGASLTLKPFRWRAGEYLNVAVEASVSWAGHTRGLLGSADGNLANELTLRDGTPLAEPVRFEELARFADSYRITAAESLFDYAPGQQTADFQQSQLTASPVLAESLPLSLLDGVEAACADKGITDPELKRACIIDVACSGEPSAGDWTRTALPSARPLAVTYDEHFSGAHCRTLSTPGYVEAELLSFATDGSVKNTQTVLGLGVPYQVRVSGQLSVAAGRVADAEYTGTSDQPYLTEDSCAGGGELGVELMPAQGSAKRTVWGQACASRGYSQQFVGRGEPLSVAFRDCNPADNQGALQLALLAPAGISPQPNLVVNGDFESWTGAAQLASYATLGANTSQLDGWGVVSAVDYVGEYWPAAKGTRSLDLNGTSQGEIRQTISTVPGARYWLFFDLAGNPVVSSNRQLRVSAGEQAQTYAFSTAGATLSAMHWRSEAFSFTAAASTTTLSFASLIGGSAGPALDNVRVVRAPD